ncbi:MAG: orotidine 5'-phosphate decarboxylase / HUMPS family protein [Patescibacteria group bacterium]
MQAKDRNKFNPTGLIIVAIIATFSINPILGGVIIILIILFLKKNPKLLSSYFTKHLLPAAESQDDEDLSEDSFNTQKEFNSNDQSAMRAKISSFLFTKTRLEKRKKYLHIALNSTLEEAEEIISQLPASDRILIEVGTPLIKIYGTEAISRIKEMTPPGTYIVADNKCADLAAREVEMMANAGANASTCLGVAPIETINSFIEECQKFNIDSMIDMMNVESALEVLKKLKKLPDVVMLHRGVDESEFSKEKQIPYYQIKQIKGNYNVLVAVAGGDTSREVQQAIFNDADIVVVWKNFYKSSAQTAQLAESFLREIK